MAQAGHSWNLSPRTCSLAREGAHGRSEPSRVFPKVLYEEVGKGKPLSLGPPDGGTLKPAFPLLVERQVGPAGGDPGGAFRHLS